MCHRNEAKGVFVLWSGEKSPFYLADIGKGLSSMFFWDYDNKIARAYGSAPLDGSEAKCYCKWVIINPMTQVTAVILLREDRGDIAEALDHVVRVSPAGRLASMDIQAAAIVLENVFGHKTCRSADETTFSPTKPNAGPSPRTSVAASCRR